jgi:hypothetical protein
MRDFQRGSLSPFDKYANLLESTKDQGSTDRQNVPYQNRGAAKPEIDCVFSPTTNTESF